MRRFSHDNVDHHAPAYTRHVHTVLLDVDGTLVDSSKPILRALNEALSAHGLGAISGDDLWRHVGPPLGQTLESLLSSRGEDVGLTPRLVDDFRTAYQPLSLELAATYPGVRTMLDTLFGTVLLAVVTSKPVVYAVPILDQLGFARFMEVIEGPDTAEVEPKATTLRRALDRLRVEPSSSPVTMVGDRRQDVEAGRACSTRTVGVTWGFGSRAELESSGADEVIDSPDQLESLIR